MQRGDQVAAPGRADNDVGVNPSDRHPIDVFELGHQHPPAASDCPQVPDRVRAGSHPHRRIFGSQQDRWRDLRAGDQRLLTVGAIGLLVALIGVIGAIRAHPRVVRSDRTTVVPATAVRIDATGCPQTRRCDVRSLPGPSVSAVHAALPSARIGAAGETVDDATGRIYRLSVLMFAPQTVIRVSSGCVPNAAAVSDTPLTVRQVVGSTIREVPVDQPTPPGPKYWSITLGATGPNTAGCGVYVEARSSLTNGIGGLQIDTIVNLLADDPRLMA